ncbi:MAG: hypothetical protein GX454_12970 [Brooklawnia sp.]|nr:hypothetical protein [Brooklawnia sp.]
MPTPLATIADALIEFILSLLRDPRALAEFEAEPEQTLARQGLSSVCVDDVRSVVPVVVERPEVTPIVVKAPAPVIQPVVSVTPTPPQSQSPVVKEIVNVANNFHIDNRSTIVDQSVNQNIWAQGDVTQIFDQEAVLAMGDNSIAVGDNALIDHSKTDVTVGDVAIGNTNTDVVITDSFNDHSTDADLTGTSVTEPLTDQPSNVTVAAVVSDSFQAAASAIATADSAVADATDYVSPAPYEAQAATFETPIDYEAAGYESAAVEVETPLEMAYEEPQ